MEPRRLLFTPPRQQNQALAATPYAVAENYGSLPNNHTHLQYRFPHVDRNKKQSNLVLRLPPPLLSFHASLHLLNLQVLLV